MSSAIIPIPQIPVNVRVATADDVPFIDALQKKHSRMVGFMKTQALLGKVAAGEVLVAVASGQLPVASGGQPSSLATGNLQLATHPSPIGYVIGTDRYFKRDDVGIIYQLNVVPGRQRGFVGATLLKAMFDRAAWGCRLFCCWCAQDIEANRFWEAMGFVPLAYRAGGRGRGLKGEVRGQKSEVSEEGVDGSPGLISDLRPLTSGSPRVHIFWQKRIRRGDTGGGATPWWFPSQTTGGSIREDRLVLPIPPGTHWSDAKPIVLPGIASCEPRASASGLSAGRALPDGRGSREHSSEPAKRRPVSRTSGLSFAAPARPVNDERPKRERKPKATGPERSRRKNDPRLVAAARELKDRWLEHVNRAGGLGGDGDGGYGEDLLLLPQGKYELTRVLPRPTGIPLPFAEPRLLPHAA
jgi:hypothetical protein